MPKLPIPSLENTCKRWLKAVTPLMTPEELQATTAAITDFASSSGAPLQAILKARDASHPDNSYINDYWKEMYLKEMRMSLPINVNPFLQFVDDARTSDPCVRAASLVHSAMFFYKALSDETLEADVFHVGTTAQEAWFKRAVMMVPKSLTYYAAYAAKSYPLDMSQYPWLLGTSRIPGQTRDALYRNVNARHIAVLHGNNFYTVDTLSNDYHKTPVSQAELERAFRWILAQPASGGSFGAGSLTALSRDQWAEARPTFVKQNPRFQELIEGALFVLAFDDRPVSDAGSAAKVFLHGRHNRWYDKSLQLIVSANAKAAINFEHSWGDGVSVLRFANEICEDSFKRPLTAASQASSSSVTNVVKRVNVNLNGVLNYCAAGDKSLKDQGDALTTEELRINGFGKSFFKSKRISPDGTVQNGIQLAYRKAFGKTVATYESASTAGFKKGRTETIRPATVESKALVDAFMSSSSQKSERERLLRVAADAHRQNSTEAAMGQGMDRHLFALRRIAMEQGGELPAIFRDASYPRMNHNILSTSTLVSPFLDGGGFGPVVEDGFGVGYGTTDDGIAFVATTYRGRNDMQQFLQALRESLEQFKTTLE